MKNRFVKSLGNFGKLVLKWTFYFLLIIVIALTIKVFFVEIYRVPSSSMEPTLISGDFIMVSKMSYGARLLKFRKFFKEGKIEYIRIWGWNHIKRGDVFVFNWPNYRSLTGSSPNMYGDYIVKRCYGLPGDSVVIENKGMKNEEIRSNKLAEVKSTLFPYDSILNWTLDRYGPLLVPGKGITLELTPVAAKHYKDVILYEGYKTKIRNDSVFLSGIYTKTLTFKNNYYFMKGDNFYGSQDSRYWGFVPEDNVVGKVTLITFSFEEYGSWLKRIRWRRIIKPIK